jgi:acyl-coenzyme A synthetase/AMP-(fatty) acid ligase
MTADYVAFHALQRPDAVALLINGRAIAYAEFARDIRKFTRAMREFGVPVGGTLAVGCEDIYVQWLILLACERLGIATTSLISPEEASVLALVAGVDLLLSESPLPKTRPRRRHDLTPAWVESVLRLPDAEGPTLAGMPDEGVVRILRTSGTTGIFMRIAVTRRMHEVRINHWIWCYGLSTRSRVMVAMPFVIGGVYTFATACLRAGGTVVWEDKSDVPTALRAHGVTNIALLPIYLRSIIDQMPKGFPRQPEVVVSTFGGAISPSLRAHAVERLVGAVCDMYGCNEVGFIGSNGLHRVGRYIDIWPGVAVEVTDEHDRPLPPGEIGRLRVRTGSMFRGYLDDPETTGRMLRGGWFYPGDLGVLHGARELELVGRADELLNIGGVKFFPERIEDALLKTTGIEEIGVGSIANAQGIGELCVAVAEAGIEEAELRQRIGAVLAKVGFQKLILARLARIPRNAAGKIDRPALKEAMLAAARPGRERPDR